MQRERGRRAQTSRSESGESSKSGKKHGLKNFPKFTHAASKAERDAIVSKFWKKMGRKSQRVKTSRYCNDSHWWRDFIHKKKLTLIAYSPRQSIRGGHSQIKADLSGNHKWLQLSHYVSRPRRISTRYLIWYKSHSQDNRMLFTSKRTAQVLEIRKMETGSSRK